MTKQWQLAHGRSLIFGEQAHIMGILNITPDSFSDGGHHDDMERALETANAMIAAGASIIDIGGESTKPDAIPVDALTEQSRVLPVIRAVAAQTNCLISIDTYRAETAAMGVEAGAHIINDVWGLQRDQEIAKVAKETGAGLVIMHTDRGRQRKQDIIADQFTFLGASLEIAAAAGILPEQIVLDPGFGFNLNTADDITLLAHFGALRQLGYPLLAGTSRKRFIGEMTGQPDPLLRDVASASTSLALRLAGADILRVHQVAFSKDTLAIADVILQSRASWHQE